MDTYYIDGKYVEEDKAMVSVKDITVLRGYGVFDFMITYNKRPFRLEEHVTRFENSAARIGLQLHHSHQEICDIVKEAIRRIHITMNPTSAFCIPGASVPTV